jgi:hypothetical protein
MLSSLRFKQIYDKLMSEERRCLMTLGVQGTGPYGKIRSLQHEINDCKYELGLIAEGMRRPLSSKRLNEIIEENRAKIRAIKAAEQAKKNFLISF